ncbi:type III pantothenate kinase [Congregibacter variabilis]|uniref:Type III pantothenate kinase n=1 Tax=Congregibacter variabilis TaxID=3081200 RepID=A0ABZ0I2Z2_9GAMM|nr:type III pantothenate kinase [Congregibacter sp. IMCC43200]
MSGATLLLDIGNSSAKWMYVDAAGVRNQGRVDTHTMVAELGESLAGATVLVSSVAAPDIQEALHAELAALSKSVWFARSLASLDGLLNSYEDPTRMGVDRWLAMLAARQRVSGRVCVVDAGSALTIDLLTADGRHEGGYIIPGTALMERSLFADTGRVRDSAPENTSVAPGRSTAEAVSHGLMLAQAGAVRMAMSLAEAQGERPQLLLCGGGSAQLAEVLDLAYDPVPNLVFEGLLRQAELEVPGLVDYPQVSSVLFAKSD